MVRGGIIFDSFLTLQGPESFIPFGDEPFGANVYEKIGRSITGPGPSLAIEVGKAATTEPRKYMTATEKLVANAQRIPTLKQFVDLYSLATGNTDVNTPDGETKYRRKLRDVIMGMGSFRSSNEANIQLAINGVIELEKESSRLKNAMWVAMQSRDSDKVKAAREAIKARNKMWPEAAITPEELQGYISRRQSGAEKTDVERTVGKKYRALMPRQ